MNASLERAGKDVYRLARSPHLSTFRGRVGRRWGALLLVGIVTALQHAVRRLRPHSPNHSAYASSLRCLVICPGSPIAPRPEGYFFGLALRMTLSSRIITR